MAGDLRSSWARGEAWAPARDWRRLRVSPAVGAAAGTPPPGFPRAPPPCPRRRGLPCHRHPQSVSCDRRCRERGVALATSLRARGAHAPRPSACVGATSAARPSGMRPEGRPWGGGEDGVRSQPGPPVSPDDLPAGSRSPPSLPAGGHRPPRPAKGKRTLRVPPMQTAPLRDLRGRPVPTGSPGGGGRVGVRRTRGRLGFCHALVRSVRGCALWSAPAQVRGAGGPGSWPCEQTLLGAGAGKAPPCPGAHLPGTRACRVPCARPPAAAHPAGDAASALARQAPPLPYPVRLLVLSISGTE